MLCRVEWKVLGVACCLAALGCGEGVDGWEPAQLELTWDVAPFGCEEAGVQTVEVEVTNRHHGYDGRFGCDEGAGSIDGVHPGVYQVKWRGYDGDGTASHVAKLEDVLVRPGATAQAPPVELASPPESVEVNWALPEGISCGEIDVDALELTVYAGGYHEVHRAEYGCDDEPVEVLGLVAGSYMFRIRATGADTVLEGLVERQIGPGEPGEVTVQMVTDEQRQ